MDKNKELLENSLAYARAMETRILTGKVIADVIYEITGDRILVTMTETGKYGYAVFENGAKEPVYLVEGDYLIEDLQKWTDYKGQTLLYPGAKSMIEKNMVGLVAEYKKYPGFHQFFITAKAPEGAQIESTQQMAGYNDQYPVSLLMADFDQQTISYGALAQLIARPEKGKMEIRIGMGGINPDGTPDVDMMIKMEMEAQQARRFFGERALNRSQVEEMIGQHTKQAQALLTPMYESLGLPMYEGVDYCPLLSEGLRGEPIEKYIGENGTLITGPTKK